jgi:hypothetical protein
MAVAIGSALGGLLIAALAIGIPYWINYRSLRSQKHDLFDAQAYEQATGRSAAQIEAHASDDRAAAEPEPGTGEPG